MVYFDNMSFIPFDFLELYHYGLTKDIYYLGKIIIDLGYDILIFWTIMHVIDLFYIVRSNNYLLFQFSYYLL